MRKFNTEYCTLLLHACIPAFKREKTKEKQADTEWFRAFEGKEKKSI
jgi:hypothetical protein